MPIPDLTHLQFLILSVLMGSEASGREIRAELAKQGQTKSLAAFYQLMSRMEEAELVEGWYETRVIDGQTVKERNYRILGHGVDCWNRTNDFYAEAALLAGPRLRVERA